MMRYEYKVVAAPSKGTKAKGVKSPEDRFALMLQELMNEYGAEGWEYQRADTLPSVERSGLTGSTTNWRHMLVFRRVIGGGEFSQPVELPEEIPQPEMPVAIPEPPVNAPPVGAALREPEPASTTVEWIPPQRKNPEDSNV